MGLKSNRSPTEGEFLSEIDPEPLEESVTALGGLPLFLRTVRSLDVPGSVRRHLRLKQRERGLDEAAYVESVLTLNAVGGDCLEDFDPLREAADVTQMTGYQMPGAEGAQKFLYRFHEVELIEQAQRELPVGRVSYIPGGTARLGAGQRGSGGGVGAALRGPEDRHGGHGRDDHREMEEASQADL
jgi:hypothetical protein